MPIACFKVYIKLWEWRTKHCLVTGATQLKLPNPQLCKRLLNQMVKGVDLD